MRGGARLSGRRAGAEHHPGRRGHDAGWVINGVSGPTYGSSADCVVADWASSAAGDFVADVDCYEVITGTAADSDFGLLVTRPVHRVNGTFDYSFVYLPAESGTLSTYQYNSSHKKNSVKFLGAGRYQVTLGGPSTSGTHGVVKVTAFGSGPGDCKPISWTGTAKGEVVDVDCFAAGQVSAVGKSAAHCTVEGWSQEYTPSIDVECVDRHGNFFNSPFTIEWVVP